MLLDTTSRVLNVNDGLMRVLEFLEFRFWGRRLIFLSYSSENQKQADRVSQFMSEHGFENWQDDQKLKPGDEFEDIIIRKVQTSRCLVLLLTRASLKSEWVKKEVETAIASNIPIIPISNVPAVELRDEIDESSAWASNLFKVSSSLVIMFNLPRTY